jgi:hypothetical protein
MGIARYPSLFILDEGYEFGIKTAKYIADNMRGKSGHFPNDAGLIAQCVKNAGDGDYLEIGTYWGASAILAYLTKVEFGLGGDVYCIDDLQMGVRSVGDIMNNAEKFNANINLKVCKSNPFPLPGKFFGCVLIDGGHDFVDCWWDWTNIRRRTTKYVIFHDYDIDHRDVMEAVCRARDDYYPVRISDNTAILELLV